MSATTMPPAIAAQVDAYVATDYPELAGLSRADFRALFADLRWPDGAEGDPHTPPDPGIGLVSALAVVTSAIIPPERRVAALRLPGSPKPGILDRNHGEQGLAPYRADPVLNVPEAPVYLLTGIDRGDEFRNMAPANALPVIAERGRTPLTIDEGLSLLAAYPQLLVKNHCFMLAGSTRGDKRVPALWISEKAPKLGWCFQGVPHTWLGVASAAGRGV